MKKMYTLFAVAAMMLCSVVANAQVAEFFNTYGILGSKDWNNTEILFPDEGVILVRDDKDRIIQLISTDNEMTPIQVTNYEYDEKGKCVAKLFYNYDDLTTLIEKEVNVYDSEGRQTKWEYYSANSMGDLVLCSIEDYTYDEVVTARYKQYDVETGDLEFQQTENYKIEEDGSKEMLYYYANVGTETSPKYEMTEKHIYEYDDYGNQISYDHYEYDTEKKVWKHVNHSVNTYERDVNDRLVKCTIVSGVEDPETYYQTFTYDVQTDKIVATITSYSSKTYLTFCKKKSAASINNIIASHASDRTYNILGQPTRANHRGICIRAGKKFIQR